LSAQEFIARIHNEEDGSLWAHVLELPGCFATGDNLDELCQALEEAIPLYMADESEAGTAGQTGPPRSGHLEVGEMRVKVPA
jgi:predicted RNase H-like HicB family nuclease